MDADEMNSKNISLIETFNCKKEPSLDFQSLEKDWHNLLFHGDNKEVITYLLDNGFRGKIDLIYIDPPFDSKANYIKKIKINGEYIKQNQFSDKWKNDDYIQFMYERLILLKELLSDQGSIYLHCDWHRSHHLRCLLDEVFGEENFMNEIVWKYTGGTDPHHFFSRKHDNIFFYSKSTAKVYHKQYEPFAENTIKRFNKTDENGRRYKETFQEDGSFYKTYMKEEGKILSDVWKDDIIEENILVASHKESSDYPTQKPEALLERIIKASSNEDSIIFDCFMGSGTTQAVAQKLGRRWIGSDINKGAIQTTSKRLQKIIQEEEKNNSLIPSKEVMTKFVYFKLSDMKEKHIMNSKNIIIKETFNCKKEPKLDFQQLEKDWHHLLFHGDNKEVITHLLDNGFSGKVDLIYIDPPFDSKADYIKKIKINGEYIRQNQFSDKWKNDNYLQFMYERLILLKELLSDQGSIYLHCDWHRSHHLRCLLDEVFGEENLRNEIVWKKYSGVKNQASNKLTTQTDTIFWYSKNRNLIFNQQYKPMSDTYIDNEYKYKDADGRKYAKLRGRGYQENKGITKKKYLDENLGSPITSLWDDGNLQLNTSTAERNDYPTQKPEALLERIIKASSNEDSIIFDCFMGSGTTQAVAQKLGRRWIGSDINKGAIQTASKRLQKIIQEEEKNKGLLIPSQKKIKKFVYFKITDNKEKYMINFKNITIKETFNCDKDPKLDFKYLEKDWHHLLFHGDNKDVITYLLDNGFKGKVDLVYIDPPFDSNANYSSTITIDEKIIKKRQYRDVWKNDDYLHFIYERLILLKELLSDQGSVYLHCDWHRSHHLRCLLDEVFGNENFMNEILWCYHGPSSPGQQHFSRKHDSIFWYRKNSEKWIFNKEDIRIPYHKTTQKKFESKGTGFVSDKKINFSNGKIPEDYWNMPVVSRVRTQILDYPTQKPEALLERIIKASSNEDSIVFDCFMGSGTTQAVAQKLGRRWIGSDVNKGAIQTTSKRLQKIIQEEKNHGSLISSKKVMTKFVHLKFGSTKENIHDKGPCKAEISFDKEKGMIEIKDFVSPSIIKMLGTSNSQIHDFREMIDCVLIDNDYNEKVFNIVYNDFPKRKKEMIKGKYQITVKGKVAVKIIDKLGEDIIVILIE